MLCPAGAGNQLPVVALDILHVMIAEDKVALVKMNPINDYFGPLLKQVCATRVLAATPGTAYLGGQQ